MSGTSLDGVDGVLVGFEDAPDSGLPKVLAHLHRPFASGLAAELLALNSPGDDELHRAALAGNAVARAYAGVVAGLQEATGLPAGAIRAIGAHGQTVRHRPLEVDGTGYTLQLLNPSLLAERSGIDVVADLRSRDLAAGGQGAPLVPAFHRRVFGRTDETVAVLNLGGIANLSVLEADGSTFGFDCGPANALMDHWCRRHTGMAFDTNGAWAAQGTVLPDLLEQLFAEPYFCQPPPKSTGRDLFNPSWLDARLGTLAAPPRPEDVQATLAELTARSCAAEIGRHAATARRVWVGGGGASNGWLMGRLRALLPSADVRDTGAAGLPSAQVEASAFAWLARAFIRREAGNLPSVTGARGARVLGALYPA